MKKLIKTIAALSAMAVLAVPANMTASAYNVDSSTATHGNAMINKSTDPGRGQRWEYESYQRDLPCYGKNYLSRKGNYTYLAPVAPASLNWAEYGNCDMFGILDRTVAKTTDIAKARTYVDNIHVKRKNGHQYAVVMEYHDNSRIDSLTGTDDDDLINTNLVDYGLRMLEGPYLQEIFNKFTVSNTSDLNYNYIKQNGYFTGYMYLKNYYVAGMRLTSTDPYTTFDTPVLEPNPNGRGFRTKVKFTVRIPAIDKTILLSSSTVSTSGYNTVNVLSGIKATVNGSGTASNYIDNYSYVPSGGKKTLSIPRTEFYERNNRYQGLIRCYEYPDDLVREVIGSDKEHFENNDFIGVKRSGDTIYIYIGKKYDHYLKDVYLDGRKNNDWFSTGITKFNAFFRTMGRDELGHCRWLRSQLTSATRVYFYSGATPNSYTSSSFYNCTASELLNRLNNG